MWFNPTGIKHEIEPPANLANSANYPPDIGKPTPEAVRISKISEISNGVSCENNKADSLKLAELAELATHPAKQKRTGLAELAELATHPAKQKRTGLAEIARIATHPEKQKPISCGKCLHFKSHYSHGKGAGSCLVGGAYGSWSETQHHCTKFDAAVEWVVMPDPSPNAIMVIVYTPNGNAIEIEARAEAHAVLLQQMNPKPQGINK
jgi:hypothetical protein